MIEVEEDHVEINSGCPTSLGGSKSSDPGWAGCKERDGGHPFALMAGAVYPHVKTRAETSCTDTTVQTQLYRHNCTDTTDNCTDTW